MLSRRVATSGGGGAPAQLSAASRDACRCSLSSWMVGGGGALRGSGCRTGAARQAAAAVDARRFGVTADDAKILQERRDAKRIVKPKVDRFKDFHGRWHVAKDTEETAVLEDRL